LGNATARRSRAASLAISLRCRRGFGVRAGCRQPFRTSTRMHRSVCATGRGRRVAERPLAHREEVHAREMNPRMSKSEVTRGRIVPKR
jgi:hypothetical protein